MTWRTLTLPVAVAVLAACGSPATAPRAGAGEPLPAPSRTGLSAAPSPTGAPSLTAPSPTASAPVSTAPSPTTPSPTTPSPTAPSPTVPGASSPAPTAPDPTAPPATPTVATPEVLRPGDSGPQVREVQERLVALHYWLGAADGTYGPLTEQAVLALQGAAGLRRDGVLGPRTRRALDTGVQPAVRITKGRVTEVDRRRGLLLFAVDGALTVVLHTSTGTFEDYTYDGQPAVADTPGGRYSVSWAVDGWRDGALGRLYRPRYFHPDGIAVHGYPVVPAYPASHGCARVSLAAMDMVWDRGLMPRGSTVLVR